MKAPFKMLSIEKPILIEDLGSMRPTPTSKEKKRYGLFRCHCGNEFRALITTVKHNKTKSCGCISKERIRQMGLSNSTHGLRNHRLYSIWNALKNRCTNPKAKRYSSYGGRGITICERWLNVQNFIDDMMPTYKEGLSIDRINNDLGYSPENCRWTTDEVQARNTRIINSTNTSGYRGVSWHIRRNKYQASIMVNKKIIYLGLFIDALDAAKAYDQYIIDNDLEHTKNGVLSL